MMKNSKSVLCAALEKGKKYVFEATDNVMYIDEIIYKLVPFDQCRPSWWYEAYEKGWNDVINHSKIEVGDEIKYNYGGEKDLGVVIQTYEEDGTIGYKILSSTGCGRVISDRICKSQKTGKKYPQMSYIKKKDVTTCIMGTFDMQDLYLPAHFLHMIDCMEEEDVIPIAWIEEQIDSGKWRELVNRWREWHG